MKEYWVNVWDDYGFGFEWPFRPHSEKYSKRPLYRIHVRMKEGTGI